MSLDCWRNLEYLERICIEWKELRWFRHPIRMPCWVLSFGGVPSTSNWEKILRQNQVKVPWRVYIVHLAWKGLGILECVAREKDLNLLPP